MLKTRTESTWIDKIDYSIKSQFIEMFGEIIDSKERECTFEDICNNMIGLTYNPGNVSDEGTIVLRSGNIKDGELQIESDVVRVCNVKIKDEKYVRDNDILMCSRNGSARLVGKTCIIHEPKEEMTFGAFMTIIRTKFPYILNTFMNMDYFRNQLTSTQTASVNQITTKMLNSYKMFKPTEEEENKFADFVQQIDKSKLILFVTVRLECFMVNFTKNEF